MPPTPAVRDTAGHVFRDLVLTASRDAAGKHVFELHVAESNHVDIYHRRPGGAVDVHQVSEVRVHPVGAMAVAEKLNPQEALLIRRLYASRTPRYTLVIGQRPDDVRCVWAQFADKYSLPQEVVEAIDVTADTLHKPAVVAEMQRAQPYSAQWHALWAVMYAGPMQQ